MTVLAWIFAAMFVVFAAAQLNDPDPWQWTAIYLGAAAIWVMAALRVIVPWICIGLGAVVIVWMIIWLPGFLDWVRSGTWQQLFGALSMDKPYIEESREFLGLGLILVSATYLSLARGRRRSR